MESLIYHREIVLPEKEFLVKERLLKINKTDCHYFSDALSNIDKEILLSGIPDFKEELENFKRLKKDIKGLYLKIVYDKEVRTFDNAEQDSRILKKINLSIENDNCKYCKEVYEENFNAYIDRLRNESSFLNDEFSYITDMNRIDLENVKFIEFYKDTTAYLFHELLGHLLESDYYYMENSFIRNNTMVFPKWLMIINENGPHSESLGVGKLDDKGSVFNSTILIKDGIINDVLDCGNFRSATIYDIPIPRMRTLTVSSTVKMNEIDEVNFVDSIRINKIWAGIVNPLTGNVKIVCDEVDYCSKTISGRIRGKVLLTGNLKDLLENLVFLGESKKYKTGKCIKSGQIVNVGLNGPDGIFYNKNIKIRFLK